MTARAHRGVEYDITPAHPAADAFPWLPDDELQELADDIGAHGLRDEVDLLDDGRLLDGRNRELACRIAGVEPRYARRAEPLTDGEAVSVVVSRHIHRRNLTASQRAMIAAELANMRRGDNRHAEPVAEVPSREGTSRSQSDAAEQLQVSVASVERAAKVRKRAPELVAPVKAGALDVKTAAKAADLPKREREKIAQADEPKAEAKKALAKKRPKNIASADEPKAGAEAPPHEAFVARINKLCAALDGLKREACELAAVEPLGRHIHKESVVAQIEAARKALWQARPTEACNCVRGGAEPNPQCRACFGAGVTTASRVLKGGK